MTEMFDPVKLGKKIKNNIDKQILFVKKVVGQEFYNKCSLHITPEAFDLLLTYLETKHNDSLSTNEGSPQRGFKFYKGMKIILNDTVTSVLLDFDIQPVEAYTLTKSKIPTLPKYEVPEVGYKLIRDCLINIFGNELDKNKTTSEEVISRLMEYKRNV